MDSKVKEIYKHLAQEDKYMKTVSRNVDQEIDRIAKEERADMDTQEFEKYRDKLFEAAFIGEEAGFIKGFKYAVLLLAECFMEI
ncbi:hypothetical protein H6A64_07950 [Lacrimispora saccharolytica]|nr:hypothetical protein [Lacrimispora saccharolytica]